MVKKSERVEAGTGDVFTDLGYGDAGERRLKVQLAMRVNELVKGRKLPQSKTAALLDIPQPHVSDLVNYKLNRFSSERLLHFLTLLDHDVEIRIRPKPVKRQKGTVSVLVAA